MFGHSSFSSKSELGVFSPRNDTLSMVFSSEQYDHVLSRQHLGSSSVNSYKVFSCTNGCDFEIHERMSDSFVRLVGNHQCRKCSQEDIPTFSFDGDHSQFPLSLEKSQLPALAQTPLIGFLGPTMDGNMMGLMEFPSVPPPPPPPKKVEKEFRNQRENNNSNSKSKKFSPKGFLSIIEDVGKKGSKNLVHRIKNVQKNEIQQYRFVYHDRMTKLTRYCCRNRKKKKCNVVIYERREDGYCCIRGVHTCQPEIVRGIVQNRPNELPKRKKKAPPRQSAVVRPPPQPVPMNTNSVNQGFTMSSSRNSDESIKVIGVFPNVVTHGGFVLRIFLDYPVSHPIPSIHQIEVLLTSAMQNQSRVLLSNRPNNSENSEIGNKSGTHVSSMKYHIPFILDQGGEDCGFRGTNLQIGMILPYPFSFPHGSVHLRMKLNHIKENPILLYLNNAFTFKPNLGMGNQMQQPQNNSVFGDAYGPDQQRKSKKRKISELFSQPMQQKQQQLPPPIGGRMRRRRGRNPSGSGNVSDLSNMPLSLAPTTGLSNNFTFFDLGAGNNVPPPPLLMNINMVERNNQVNNRGREPMLEFLNTVQIFNKMKQKGDF